MHRALCAIVFEDFESQRQERWHDFVHCHKAHFKIQECSFTLQLLAIKRLVDVTAAGDTGNLLDTDEKSTHLLLFRHGCLVRTIIVSYIPSQRKFIRLSQ
jgi:peroxiredoxin family protein